MDEHRVLYDETTGRPILMAPVRQKRPRTTGPEKDAQPRCPFCEGHERDTPPETDAIRAEGTAPDSPGWSVRAFTNLYPATSWHEVVAEGPDHTVHPSELGEELLAQCLAVYRRRITTIEDNPEVRTAYLFKNTGHAAGASIEHSHSQILGIAMLPPRLERELRHFRSNPGFYEAEIDRAQAANRIVFEGQHHVVLCPQNPKLPFESWLLPRSRNSDFLAGEHADDLARCLRRHFTAVAGALGTPPLNWWLHRIPGEDFHWHFELQPRTGQVAGLELGGDMYINAVPSETAAERLREALRSAS